VSTSARIGVDAVEPPKADPTREAPLNTNATRHLSAGAYLDPQFCLAALHKVYYQPKRIIAPSYGFDAIVVLGHCLRARRAMLVRDALLFGTLLLAFWSFPPAFLVTLFTLLVVQVAAVAGRVGRDSVRYLRDETQIETSSSADENRPTPGSQRPHGGGYQSMDRRSGSFRRLWLENLFAQIVGRVIGVALNYLMFCAIAVALAILAGHVSLGGAPRFRIPPLFAIGGPIVLSFLIPAATRAWNQLQLRALVPEHLPDRRVRTHRLAEIERQMGGNTVVYSGYRPFVGSGKVLRRWDLAQRLVRPVPRIPGLPDDPGPEVRREFDTPPFTAQEINEYVRDHIAGLAGDEVPERQLPHLTVADQIFVAGTEVSELRPYTSTERMAQIIRRPTAPERHYLAFQIVSWRGELVTTVYVHFAVQGKALYLELHVTGLVPCDEAFRVVDQVGGTGLKNLFRDTAKGALEAPTLIASVLKSLGRAGIDILGLASAATSIRVKKGYDYGAVIGVRELGASIGTRDYMQTQDIVKYGRVIERRVLAAVLDFLEDRGVDVTEYRQRSLTILNAGAVAMNGGTVHVGGDAIGTQDNSTEGGTD
jgi:hypothetical protein